MMQMLPLSLHRWHRRLPHSSRVTSRVMQSSASTGAVVPGLCCGLHMPVAIHCNRVKFCTSMYANHLALSTPSLCMMPGLSVLFPYGMYHYTTVPEHLMAAGGMFTRTQPAGIAVTSSPCSTVRHGRTWKIRSRSSQEVGGKLGLIRLYVSAVAHQVPGRTWNTH
jgi:hypothetical protein